MYLFKLKFKRLAIGFFTLHSSLFPLRFTIGFFTLPSSLFPLCFTIGFFPLHFSLFPFFVFLQPLVYQHTCQTKFFGNSRKRVLIKPIAT